MRGYDDTELLTEMAKGYFTRRYSSVDEAAKKVTGEDGGANVDRLRRKFRADGWFERGLDAYVQAELARRGVISGARDVSTTPGNILLNTIRRSSRSAWDVFVHILFKSASLCQWSENRRKLPVKEIAGRICIFGSALYPIAIVLTIMELAIEQRPPTIATAETIVRCAAFSLSLHYLGTLMTRQRWWTSVGSPRCRATS